MTEQQKTDTLILFLMALGAVLFHILLNGQYGFHRDELDFIMNARRLDWGYVAYPPITPLFARIGLELFGESLRGLRVLSAIAQGIVMVLAGLMARDMGGRRNAQLMAAFAVFIAPISLIGGTVIMYFAFDYLWWALVAFFMVRLLATDDPRYWLGIGAGIGLGMMTKYTMAIWVIGLIVAVIVTPARKYLRSKWLYLGAGLAFLLCLPNLVWQIQHGFISLDFLASIHQRDIEWGRTDSFIPDQFYLSTNPLSLPLWVAGLVLCLFSPSMKRFRVLGWMFVVTFLLFLISKGRGYYMGPAYVMLFAAGAVWFEKWLEPRSVRIRQLGFGLLWGVLVIGSLIGISLMKPIAPINSPVWNITSGVHDVFIEMVGWQDLTAQVANVYQAIPKEERPRTVIYAGNYGEAGAIDLYGKQYGLPRVVSGSNSLWYRGYGDTDPKTVITVGVNYSEAGMMFRSCKVVGKAANHYGVKNEESTRHTAILVCRDPIVPWQDIWAQAQDFQ
jgi:4-amino-4-deoxy-L-arabinose transferase and related glycosyltransferases of PMT family